MNFTPPTRNANSAKIKDSGMVFLDPILIQAARNIYRNYSSLNLPLDSPPTGVVINRDSHRGQLAFSSKPILLPRECFIPLKQIKAEVY